MLTPAGWMPHWDAMLESGAAMGARRAIVLHYDPEPARAQALLAELAAKAADHGIGVDVEFIARSGLTSLADACDLVEAIGGDCGVVLLWMKRAPEEPQGKPKHWRIALGAAAALGLGLVFALR